MGRLAPRKRRLRNQLVFWSAVYRAGGRVALISRARLQVACSILVRVWAGSGSRCVMLSCW
eukprot:2618789-Rhodomonas_salina.1